MPEQDPNRLNSVVTEGLPSGKDLELLHKAENILEPPVAVDPNRFNNGEVSPPLEQPSEMRDTLEREKLYNNKKILVLHLTTSFGKHYTCRTVDELETYIDNIKKEIKRKRGRNVRDEDIDLQIGFGRMTQAAYDTIPACKYFIKT